MILLLRLTPLLTAILVYAGVEVILRWTSLFHWVALILVLILIGAVMFLRRRLDRQTLFFLAPALLLVVGTLLFLLVLNTDERVPLHRIIALLACLLLWNYLEQLFAFHHHAPSYQAFALENISSYINLGNVFLIVSGLFGLHFLINYPLWIAVVLSGATIFLSVAHTLFMGKIDHPQRQLYAVLIGLLCTEVLVALALLPVDHFVIALLIATTYFVLVNLSYHHLRSSLDRQYVRRYVLLAVVVLSLTVLTAAWR